MTPLITVIVPIYNVERYLANCLDSILAQSYSNLEIILINDGSTDKSGDICNKYARENRSVFIKHQENAGVSVARNNGMQQAKGDYVTFVDGDDWLEANAIEVMVRELEASGADCIRTSYSVAKNKKTIAPSNEHIKTGIVDGSQLETLRYDVITGNIRCYSWLLAIKTSVLRSHSITFPKGISMMEDMWFYSDMLQHIKSIYLSDKITYNYAIHGQSATTSINGFEEKIDSILKVNKHVTQKGFSSSQCKNINAVHLATIMSMVMVRADRAKEMHTVYAMMKVVAENQEVINLQENSSVGILSLYQKMVIYAVIHKNKPILNLLVLIRKMSGK